MRLKHYWERRCVYKDVSVFAKSGINVSKNMYQTINIMSGILVWEGMCACWRRGKNINFSLHASVLLDFLQCVSVTSTYFYFGNQKTKYKQKSLKTSVVDKSMCTVDRRDAHWPEL